LNHTARISFYQNSDDKVWPKKSSSSSLFVSPPERKGNIHWPHPTSLLLMAPVPLRKE
jgi:hypothetical protein